MATANRYIQNVPLNYVHLAAYVRSHGYAPLILDMVFDEVTPEFVDREIRVLDYIEGVGQVLAYYVKELRSRGWGEALCVLPHDGVAENSITGKRYEDHVRDAVVEVQVIKNQGKGAAMMRIESARRLFSRIWFNEVATEAGREALGWYHEKKDETRSVGLGPEHDWSSHAADAFGLMCLAYEEPERAKAEEWAEAVEGGWMG